MKTGDAVRSAPPRPFPWASLDATSWVELEALRALRRWATSSLRPSDVARVLGERVSARVEIMLRSARPLEAVRALDDGVGAVVSFGDAGTIAHSALVEVEGALATALVARVLRRKLPAMVGDARSAAIAGAFAAIVVSTLRGARAEVAPRILAAGPSAALMRDLSRADPDLLVIELTVLVDDEAFLARVAMPRAAAIRARAEPWRLDALSEVRLALTIVGAASTSTAADIASLRIGDAWMPHAWSLRRAEAGGGWTGQVLLASSSSELGIRAELGPEGRLMLAGGVEPLGWTPDDFRGRASMDDSNVAEALVDAVGEVPVVVRVEIGAAEMRAREWASLSKGDVIALGTRIGEPVILRAGGIPIARGELVDVEGEVGVRIVDLLDSKESRT